MHHFHNNNYNKYTIIYKFLHMMQNIISFLGKIVTFIICITCIEYFLEYRMDLIKSSFIYIIYLHCNLQLVFIIIYTLTGVGNKLFLIFKTIFIFFYWTNSLKFTKSQRYHYHCINTKIWFFINYIFSSCFVAIGVNFVFWGF